MSASPTPHQLEFCDYCNERPAQVWCDDCEQKLCSPNGCDHEIHATKGRAQHTRRPYPIEAAEAVMEEATTAAEAAEVNAHQLEEEQQQLNTMNEPIDAVTQQQHEKEHGPTIEHDLNQSYDSHHEPTESHEIDDTADAATTAALPLSTNLNHITTALTSSTSSKHNNNYKTAIYVAAASSTAPSSSSSQELCINCESYRAEVECLDCDIKLCIECDEEIHSDKMKQEHTREMIGGSGNGNAVAEQQQKEDTPTEVEEEEVEAKEEMKQPVESLPEIAVAEPAATLVSSAITSTEPESTTPAASTTSVTSPTEFCTYCEERPAVMWCETCEMKLCAPNGCDQELHAVKGRTQHTREEYPIRRQGSLQNPRKSISNEGKSPMFASAMLSFPPSALSSTSASSTSSTTSLLVLHPTSTIMNETPISTDATDVFVAPASVSLNSSTTTTLVMCDNCFSHTASVHCTDCHQALCQPGCDEEVHAEKEKSGHVRNVIGVVVKNEIVQDDIAPVDPQQQQQQQQHSEEEEEEVVASDSLSITIPTPLSTSVLPSPIAHVPLVAASSASESTSNLGPVEEVLDNQPPPVVVDDDDDEKDDSVSEKGNENVKAVKEEALSTTTTSLESSQPVPSLSESSQPQPHPQSHQPSPPPHPLQSQKSRSRPSSSTSASASAAASKRSTATKSASRELLLIPTPTHAKKDSKSSSPSLQLQTNLSNSNLTLPAIGTPSHSTTTKVPSRSASSAGKLSELNLEGLQSNVSNNNNSNGDNSIVPITGSDKSEASDTVSDMPPSSSNVASSSMQSSQQQQQSSYQPHQSIYTHNPPLTPLTSLFASSLMKPTHSSAVRAKKYSEEVNSGGGGSGGMNGGKNQSRGRGKTQNSSDSTNSRDRETPSPTRGGGGGIKRKSPRHRTGGGGGAGNTFGGDESPAIYTPRSQYARDYPNNGLISPVPERLDTPPQQGSVTPQPAMTLAAQQQQQLQMQFVAASTAAQQQQQQQQSGGGGGQSSQMPQQQQMQMPIPNLVDTKMFLLTGNSEKDKVNYNFVLYSLRNRVMKLEEQLDHTSVRAQKGEEVSRTNYDAFQREMNRRKEAEFVYGKEKTEHHATVTLYKRTEQELNHAREMVEQKEKERIEEQKKHAEEILQYQSQIKQLQSQLTSHQTIIQHKSSDITQLQTELHTHRDTIKELRAQIQSEKDLNSTYRSYSLQYETLIHTLREQLGETERKQIHHSKWKLKAHQYAEEWESERKYMKKHIHTLTTTLENTRKDLKDYRSILKYVTIKGYINQWLLRRMLRKIYIQICAQSTSLLIEQTQSTTRIHSSNQFEEKEQLEMRNSRLLNEWPWKVIPQQQQQQSMSQAVVAVSNINHHGNSSSGSGTSTPGAVTTLTKTKSSTNNNIAAAGDPNSPSNASLTTRYPPLIALVQSVSSQLHILSESSRLIIAQKHKWQETADSFFQRNIELTNSFLETDQELNGTKKKTSVLRQHTKKLQLKQGEIETEVMKLRQEKIQLQHDLDVARKNNKHEKSIQSNQHQSTFDRTVELSRRCQNLEIELAALSQQKERTESSLRSMIQEKRMKEEQSRHEMKEQATEYHQAQDQQDSMLAWSTAVNQGITSPTRGMVTEKMRRELSPQRLPTQKVHLAMTTPIPPTEAFEGGEQIPVVAVAAALSRPSTSGGPESHHPPHPLFLPSSSPLQPVPMPPLLPIAGVQTRSTGRPVSSPAIVTNYPAPPMMMPMIHPPTQQQNQSHPFLMNTNAPLSASGMPLSISTTPTSSSSPQTAFYMPPMSPHTGLSFQDAPISPEMSPRPSTKSPQYFMPIVKAYSSGQEESTSIPVQQMKRGKGGALGESSSLYDSSKESPGSMNPGRLITQRKAMQVDLLNRSILDAVMLRATTRRVHTHASAGNARIQPVGGSQQQISGQQQQQQQATNAYMQNRHPAAGSRAAQLQANAIRGGGQHPSDGADSHSLPIVQPPVASLKEMMMAQQQQQQHATTHTH